MHAHEPQLKRIAFKQLSQVLLGVGLVEFNGTCLLGESNFVLSSQMVEFGQMLLEFGSCFRPIAFPFELRESKLKYVLGVVDVDAFEMDVVHVYIQ